MNTIPLRAIFLSAVLFGVAACHNNKPTPDVQTEPSSTPSADTEPAAKPDAQGVTYGDGFYKDEAGPVAVIRWVRGNAACRVNAPTAGRYRLTFRAFTVFSTVENTVEVSVNGEPAGTFAAHAFDLANPTATTLEASLRAGSNEVRLHSKGGETRLGEADDRTPAYGLVVPVKVERVP